MSRGLLFTPVETFSIFLTVSIDAGSNTCGRATSKKHVVVDSRFFRQGANLLRKSNGGIQFNTSTFFSQLLRFGKW